MKSEVSFEKEGRVMIMFGRNLAVVFLSLAFGTICSWANIGSSQESIELPDPAFSSPEVEEVGADFGPQSPGDNFGVETLTRGPLHEAFAEPIVSNPTPGMIVDRAPPLSIQEIPPEFQPEGDGAVWISGYWGWDEQRNEFIWISGVYRFPPEGLHWIAGYWDAVDVGWRWVPGLWMADDSEPIVYLPPPPTTLENGPSSPAPGPDHFYVPGNWTQTATGYGWSVGYWHPMQADLIWVPTHTVWTPQGYRCIPGYWDHRLPLRGFCFAPVSIPPAIYSRPGWFLRPRVVLNSQVVLRNLFVQPGYSHYLFGDYYGVTSTRRAILPAYVYHSRRGSCDPLIAFYTAYNARQGQDLIGWYGNQHADLLRNPSKRPPQIWSPAILSRNSQPLGALASNVQPARIAHSFDEALRMDGATRSTKIPSIAKVSKGIAPPASALPPLNNLNSRPKNEPSPRIGKTPELPRLPNRDRLNPRDDRMNLRDDRSNLKEMAETKRLLDRSGQSNSPSARLLTPPANPAIRPAAPIESRPRFAPDPIIPGNRKIDGEIRNRGSVLPKVPPVLQSKPILQPPRTPQPPRQTQLGNRQSNDKSSKGDSGRGDRGRKPK